MSQVAAEYAAPTGPLWRNFSFHIMWGSTFASGVGDRLIMLAALKMLGYAGDDVDNSSIQGGINFFFFLPYLVWSPMAGWLADRLPRKWLMFASDELRGLIVLYGFLLLPPDLDVVPAEDRWQVWALLCAVGVMAATFVPAKMSSVPNVVGLELLSRANAMVVSMGIIGNLMGFLIAYAMIDHSLRAMILTSSLCYLVSGALWAFLKMPFKPRSSARSIGSPWDLVRDIHQGMRYAWTHKPVRVLLLTNAVVWSGVAVYQPAVAVVNTELYSGTAADLSLVLGAVGLGMLVASAVFGVMNPRLGNEILIVLGLAVCGLFIILQMIVPVFGLGVAIALMTGIGGGTIFVPLYTVLARSTADHIRGRVFAAKEVVGELGQVTVSFLVWSAPQTDRVMRPAAVLVAGLLLVLAVVGLVRYVLVGPTPSKVLNLCWRLTRLYTDAVHRLKVVGRHRVPSSGPVLLVSNHTSGLDPALIQSATSRMVRWMMAREYLLPGLGWFWRRYCPILVDRNAADPGAAKAAIDGLRAGQTLGLFPEGRINYDSDGLLPLGAGVALIARRSDATIVPVHISGTPRGVKPLKSFLIPSRSRVTFGKPFRLSEEESADREQALEVIRQKMAETMGTSNAN